MDKALFVSAGMPAPKKRDHVLARRQLYLNYGALTLATVVERAGSSALLIHGEHQLPADFLEGLYARGHLPSRYPVMLSIPSFYAMPWAQEFCRLLKAKEPGCIIVVGGRWVVGPDPEWFKTKLPEADRLVTGLGEPVIEKLLSGSSVSIDRAQSPTPNFVLNHRLVDEFEKFQPSIEASRGCGMGCAFCEERDIRLERLRDPTAMAEFINLTSLQYGEGIIHPYFQSSFFAPPIRWAEQLASEVAARSISVRWRTESRVDAISPATVAALAAAGLKVIDLGLETASPTQITAMSKSSKPDAYLRKASELVRACRDSGILVKANVLLYAGETQKTIDETSSWLDEHADCITGVSVGPVIAYGPPKTANVLLEAWRILGANPVAQDSAFLTGISTLHLSKEIDALAAESISLQLSRRFMNVDDYFILKSFSYYPRGYSRAQFDTDVASSDPKVLPFSLRRNLTVSEFQVPSVGFGAQSPPIASVGFVDQDTTTTKP